MGVALIKLNKIQVTIQGIASLKIIGNFGLKPALLSNPSHKVAVAQLI